VPVALRQGGGSGSEGLLFGGEPSETGYQRLVEDQVCCLLCCVLPAVLPAVRCVLRCLLLAVLAAVLGMLVLVYPRRLSSRSQPFVCGQHIALLRF